MNYRKCNKGLNRIRQARKVTRALNSPLWSKDIVVNTKRSVFCTVIESILSYGWEIWTLVYKLKKKNCLVQKWILGKELQGPPDK